MPRLALDVLFVSQSSTRFNNQGRSTRGLRCRTEDTTLQDVLIENNFPGKADTMTECHPY